MSLTSASGGGAGGVADEDGLPAEEDGGAGGRRDPRVAGPQRDGEESLLGQPPRLRLEHLDWPLDRWTAGLATRPTGERRSRSGGSIRQLSPAIVARPVGASVLLLCLTLSDLLVSPPRS